MDCVIFYACTWAVKRRYAIYCSVIHNISNVINFRLWTIALVLPRVRSWDKWICKCMSPWGQSTSFFISLRNNTLPRLMYTCIAMTEHVLDKCVSLPRFAAEKILNHLNRIKITLKINYHERGRMLRSVNVCEKLQCYSIKDCINQCRDFDFMCAYQSLVVSQYESQFGQRWYCLSIYFHRRTDTRNIIECNHKQRKKQQQ